MAITYKTSDGNEFNTHEEALKHEESNGFDEFHKEIHKTVEQCKKTVTLCSDEIRRQQRNCSHPLVTAMAKSDTGNYDPSEDSYWYDINCKCCYKTWTEDQSTSKYKNNPNVEWIKRK